MLIVNLKDEKLAGIFLMNKTMPVSSNRATTARIGSKAQVVTVLSIAS